MKRRRSERLRLAREARGQHEAAFRVNHGRTTPRLSVLCPMVEWVRSREPGRRSIQAAIARQRAAAAGDELGEGLMTAYDEWRLRSYDRLTENGITQEQRDQHVRQLAEPHIVKYLGARPAWVCRACLGRLASAYNEPDEHVTKFGIGPRAA